MGILGAAKGMRPDIRPNGAIEMAHRKTAGKMPFAAQDKPELPAQDATSVRTWGAACCAPT
jgi:hypothetical protein